MGSTYLGLSQRYTPLHRSQASLTNHSSGKTASPKGWRASAGSQGLSWSLIGWPHSQHNSTGNPADNVINTFMCLFVKGGMWTQMGEILRKGPRKRLTERQERWWPSTVRRAVAAVTYIWASWVGGILPMALSLRLTALRDRDKAHKLLRWGSLPKERQREHVLTSCCVAVSQC